MSDDEFEDRFRAELGKLELTVDFQPYGYYGRSNTLTIKLSYKGEVIVYACETIEPVCD